MEAAKRAHEMALIGEAHGHRHLRGGLATAQQRTSARQAYVGLISMRRQAHAATERAQEMELTEPSGSGQLMQRHLLRVAGVQYVAGTPNSRRLMAARRLDDAAVDAIGEHAIEHEREQLLSLERGCLAFQGGMQPR